MKCKQQFVIDYLGGGGGGGWISCVCVGGGGGGGGGGQISYDVLTPGRVGIAFGSVKTKAL